MDNRVVYTLQTAHCYERIQHLTSSILPAKSESLHQCEMDNKVERLRRDYPSSFSSMQMLGTRPIGAKPNLYCEAIELVCGGSPKLCVLVDWKALDRVKSEL